MRSFSTGMRSLNLSCAIVALLSAPADAQTKHNILRGLAHLQLLIESLDSSAASCGLTKSAIENAIKYPLSSEKLALVNDSDEVLYVNILSVYHESKSYCVTYAQVEVYSYQSVTLKFSGRDTVTEIPLWDHGFIISSDQSEHAERVEHRIEDFTKRLITDWNLDNKDVR